MNGTAIDPSPNRWTWLRLLAGAAVLVVLAVRLGADPFLDGLRDVDATALLVGLATTAATTLACAWRWSLLSGRLDVAVPVRTAYRRYYRSQLLNATLPGGVLGDVHRGVDHGLRSGALGAGFRSVVWDRGTGQAVQAVLAVAALALLPAAVRADVGWLLLALGAVLVVAALALPRRVRRAAAAELRTIGPVLPPVGLASALAAAGHVVVFVVVARSVGVDVALPRLAALGVVVLLASALPLSLAGWGPREGVAAWLFAEAGLGAATGLSVSVAFGLVSFVATLPGLLALSPLRSREVAWRKATAPVAGRPSGEPSGEEVVGA